MITVSLVLFHIIFATSLDQSIHLSKVKTLTLHEGKMTTGRRSAPVPQLLCMGGAAKNEQQPHIVQCYNQGFDGREYNWRCDAQLERHVRLGEVTVSCEGYRDKTDPEVLVGSCGLEYTLEYTGIPKQQQQQEQKNTNRKDDTIVTFIILVFVFGGGMVILVVSALIGYRRTYGSSNQYSDYGRSRPYNYLNTISVNPSYYNRPPKKEESVTPTITHTSTSYGGTKTRSDELRTSTSYCNETPDEESVTHTSMSYGGTKTRGDESYALKESSTDTSKEEEEAVTHISTSYGGTKTRGEESTSYGGGSSSDDSTYKRKSTSYGGTNNR